MKLNTYEYLEKLKISTSNMFNHLILQFYKIFSLIVLWTFSKNKWVKSNKLIKENFYLTVKQYYI